MNRNIFRIPVHFQLFLSGIVHPVGKRFRPPHQSCFIAGRPNTEIGLFYKVDMFSDPVLFVPGGVERKQGIFSGFLRNFPIQGHIFQIYTAILRKQFQIQFVKTVKGKFSLPFDF